MKLKIVFVCLTCIDTNRFRNGRPEYAMHKLTTEFESLTEAYQHLKETEADKRGVTHDMFPTLKEDN